MLFTSFLTLLLPALCLALPHEEHAVRAAEPALPGLTYMFSVKINFSPAARDFKPIPLALGGEQEGTLNLN